ncbi:MAG: hypothetical protein FJX76_09565 [Armatimonadetes bacterium]|nr:hypothetical protein [Armatimonadota bacterium]
MDRIARELAAFRHELDEKFTDVEERLHGVEQSMGGIKKTLDTLLDKLEAEFRFLADDREQDRQRLAGIEARLDSVERKIS